MSSQGSDENKRCIVRVDLPSDTPVVGCKINPSVRVTAQGFAKPPTHSLNFSWYRLQTPSSAQGDKRAWLGELVESCQSHDESSVAGGQVGEIWMEVGSSSTYEPSLEDFDAKLKLETFAADPLSGTPLSPINTVITEPVVFFPGRCPRRIIKIGSPQGSGNIDLTCQSSDNFAFSILSYNILADLFASMPIHEHCPKWALVWENRQENLLDEILGYSADILCLQEVQSDHFESFFVPRLNPHGYSVVYAKKETQVFTHGQHVSDGCAIFYRTDLFEPITAHELKFKELVKSVIHVPDKEGGIRLLKDNVAAVAVFKVLKGASKSEICVTNTHIHANPRLSDVKLLQITQLIHNLENIVDSQVPILICGDFNSIPASDAHSFLAKGKIDSLKEANVDPCGLYQILKLEHSLPLASAYAALFDAVETDEVKEQLSKMDSGTCEPLFTILTPAFTRTLDYIFYTANKLRVEGLLELPDRELLKDGLPSPRWPSDHIALMARFRFK